MLPMKNRILFTLLFIISFSILLLSNAPVAFGVAGPLYVRTDGDDTLCDGTADAGCVQARGIAHEAERTRCP